MWGFVGRVAIVVIVFAGLLFGIAQVKTPRHDRDWAPQFARVASFDPNGEGAYVLQNLRAFDHRAGKPSLPSWDTIELDVAELMEVWFFVEPFPVSDLFAHTFVSFVFEDDVGSRKTISISVEARRENGEKYTPLAGLMREFELSYVWSTEKDVATRIVVKQGRDLFAYPIVRPRETAVRVFEHFVEQTNALAATPRFYDTVTSNCTNELFKAVNKAYPGSVPAGPAWLFTGLSASRLHASGHLGDDDVPFSQIKADAAVDDFIREYARFTDEAFSAAWRQSRDQRVSRRLPVQRQSASGDGAHAQAHAHRARNSASGTADNA
ncbi:MAG: DUF4105 domain-containing protein [Pseudomonadota bacterium]